MIGFNFQNKATLHLMKTTLKLQASHYMAENQWSRESTKQTVKHGSAGEVLFVKKLLLEDLFFIFVFFLR